VVEAVPSLRDCFFYARTIITISFTIVNFITVSTLTITIIQTVLHWEDKAANLQMLEQKINSIKEKTEIVVLPEMFSTGFSMRPE
jgi:hypothetical protein